MENINYPHQQELAEALHEFCNSTFLKKFSSQRGIYITNANLEEQSDFLSGIFYEHDDLELIRSVALGVHEKTTLSGFWVQSDDEKYDLVYELNKYVNEVVDENLKMKLGVITGNDTEGYKGSVHYQQNQPGKQLFLQGTPRDFDFYIKKMGDRDWEVIVDGERSNDTKVMQKWLTKRLPRESGVVTIDQDQLTTKQTVIFFDELRDKGVSKEWRFLQVKRIALKRESTETEDEDEQVIEQSSVLTGISQAILEGSDLRSNSFVKQCEEGGYRFTAMNYEYEHRKNPFLMEVRAEFKGRPKVFEIALEDHWRRTGLDEKIESTPLPQVEKVKLLSRFYSEAKILFDNLLPKIPPMNSK